jgi:hypothetical protein
MIVVELTITVNIIENAAPKTTENDDKDKSVEKVRLQNNDVRTDADNSAAPLQSYTVLPPDDRMAS